MARKKENLTSAERLEEALVPEGEQPYPVPGNWCWMRGRAFLKPMETKRPEGEVFRYIDIDSIDNKRQQVTEPKNLQVKDAPSRASRKLRTGDTVFSMVRPYLMNIAYIDETISNSIASTGFYVCTPTENVNSLYLYYLMTSPYTVDGLNRYMKGDNSPSIRKDDIENYVYPIPPLPEQQRIVNRIESLFAKLDEAKQKAQDALDSFEPRKAAILHRAFTGELTAQWRKEHGVGMESWEARTSTQLFEYVTSGSRGWAKYYADNGDIFVRMGNLNHGTIELDLSDIQYVNLPGQTEGQRTKLQKNDILISITADIGMVGIVREMEQNAYINQHIALARPTAKDNAEFLAWYLISDVGLQQMRNKQRGATKIGLGLDDIRSLELLIPTREEQDEVVYILDNLLANEQQAKEAAEGVLEQIDLIKKAILARAFRGELGTNDPSEESAQELIKNFIFKM